MTEGVPNVGGEILEYFKVIAILGGIVLFALFAVRSWLPKLTGASAGTGGPLSVAWRMILEPRKTLYIVRAGSAYVLLASSDSGVQFLTSLDAGSVEAGLRDASVRAPSGFGFAAFLRARRSSRDERPE